MNAGVGVGEDFGAPEPLRHVLARHQLLPALQAAGAGFPSAAASAGRACRPAAPRRRRRRLRIRRSGRSWRRRGHCVTRAGVPSSLALEEIPDSFKTPSMAGGACGGENPARPHLEGDHPCVQPCTAPRRRFRLQLTGLAAVLATVLGFAPAALAKDQPGSRHWVATWAVSPQRAPAPLAIDGQTLRQVVHVSLGGKTIRVRLSNATARARW